ncbi:MAG TPA: adenylate/guanylate cyclase domain-containing protein [Thermoplasmata archaeon]|nr:adenylate/guanylate cyclase domain-containing protein [Thermoplasmata archaeon]
MAPKRRLAAIVFTDLVGYTSLTQSDEAGALRLLDVQQKLLRPLLETHHGRQVKAMGDGLLLAFGNALDAVEFGVGLQRAAHARAAEAVGAPLRLRIGIHLGDVQRKGSDILGDTVNVASRVEPLAEPGGICLTAQVYDQVHLRVPYQLESLGPKTVKGVREPIVLYRVVLPWIAGPSAPSAPAPPRLAVLPFANISPDPNDEYFADGLTEELISVLSRIQGLRVIARTSVGQYKGTGKPIGQVGAELGVRSVLEGSVRKSGDQLRITVQLIDVPTQEHRWAQTYDRKLDNIFAIQADVAERTAGALKVELLTPEREALLERPTSSAEAHEFYLRGLQASHRWAILRDPSGESEVVRFFESAIRADPEFATAYAQLANTLVSSMGVNRPRTEVVPRARELAARALELNPDSSDAHTARGNLAFQGELDWVTAESEFQRAIVLNPSNSAAHSWYGFLLCVLQRFDEAKSELRTAIELDPLWLPPRLNLINLHILSGDGGTAIALAEKARESFGPNPMIFGNLALAYLSAGRTDDALRAVEPLARYPDRINRMVHSACLAWTGRPEEARNLLREWERDPGTEYFPLLIAAQLYAAIGETDRAFELIERDSDTGERCFWNSYQSFLFQSIRDDPRFVALLRTMHLPLTPPKFPEPLRSPRRPGSP